MTAVNAAGATVYGLVAARSRQAPDALALSEGSRQLTFGDMISQVDRIAADLVQRGVARGDRVAVLSENRIEYTIIQLASAKLGAIVACQNWRLATPELAHCITLVDPKLLIVSPRYQKVAEALALTIPIADITMLGCAGDTTCTAEPEDGLLIIYTSGTTGLPKAAVISHRAEIARMCALRMDLEMQRDDGYISWAPMFHMGGTEHLLATLMAGAHGVVIDGFDPDKICDAIAVWRIGWLMLVPATIAPLIAKIRERNIVPKSIKAVGCMADLVPSAEVVEITRLLNAPYLNSFGATETGMPPLSGNRIAPGVIPAVLDKQLSSLAQLRLVRADGDEAQDDEPGEAWVRGPTLFSGYWSAEQANADSFVDGWFRMGDIFRKTTRGYAFVGRSKYLIKSGGENIYPAEIERVLLADPRVLDAIVVRRADLKWGEIAVAVIARNEDSLDCEAVEEICRASLAGYKRPRDVMFVDFEAFPRNVSGKIVRDEVEKMVLQFNKS